MDSVYLLLAGLFLPLFPLSMVFNQLLGRLGHAVPRTVLLLLWPQLGLLIMPLAPADIPGGIGALALATSALYALRAVALRDVGQWCGFMATSAWALLWLLLQSGTAIMTLQLYALALSIPLVLLTLLGAGLERRFGAAYTGLYGGLALSLPRFSTTLVFVVLAIIATPLFPAFFIMLATILGTLTIQPVMAFGIAGVWLLWSWAGARLLQGLIAGPPGDYNADDMHRLVSWAYVFILLLLAAAGVYGLGELS